MWRRKIKNNGPCTYLPSQLTTFDSIIAALTDLLDDYEKSRRWTELFIYFFVSYICKKMNECSFVVSLFSVWPRLLVEKDDSRLFDTYNRVTLQVAQLVRWNLAKNCGLLFESQMSSHEKQVFELHVVPRLAMSSRSKTVLER